MNIRSLPKLAHSAHRAGEVVSVLAKYGLAEWLSHTEFERPKKLFTGKDGEVLAEQSRGARIRLALTELGVTYIKFGQMLSTRPDLVGPEVADELAKLQHGVPADPPEVAMAAVAAELGRPVDKVFAEFDSKPVGSASIGQVHAARMPDGTKVVVKVQHPHIESRIRDDLEILVMLAHLAERSAELKRYQPTAVIREFQRSISRELDFSREQGNLQQFAVNFASDETVHFPRAFPELSTSRVLTMEMIAGVALDETDRLDRIGISREELARRGAIVWMEMVFRDGFFHADPHPGNLLVMPGGVIGVLDCGMVGRIDEIMREAIEEGLIAIANQDSAHLVRLLLQLCNAPADIDEAAFGSDLADYLGFYGNQPIDHLQLGDALNEMVRILTRYQLILPSGVSRLIKTFVMLEGTARLISPKVNVLKLIKSYERKVILRQHSPQARWKRMQLLLAEWRRVGQALPRTLEDILRKVQSGKFDINLEHRRLEPSVNRLVMGMVTSALFLGSAVLWSNRVPPIVNGYSLPGVTGCAVSMVLGWRLLRKIWRD
jgi:ubiquinone biosynthesis protein